MIMKSKLASAAVALLGASGLMLSTTSVAHADYDTASEHYWTTAVSTIKVKEYGDVVRLCDNSNTIDKNPSAYVWYYSPSEGKWILRYGFTLHGYNKGECKTHSASEGGLFNLPENRKIKVRITGASGYAYHTFYNDY